MFTLFDDFHCRRNLDKIFGSDNIDLLRGHVQGGNVTKEDITEFAELLGNNNEPNRILGNHKRRMEQKNEGRYDVEVMEILNDWWNEELFDLSTDDAYQKLFDVFSTLRGFKAFSKQFQETRVKRVVLLGESGSGKSAIGNCLLGLDSGSGFEESNKTASCTKTTRELQGKLIHNETEQTFTIVDTPGMNDSDNNDTKNIRSIVEFLHDREYANTFLLVRNGKICRMNHSFKTMLSTFELSLGKEFWRHVIIGVSHTSYTEEEEEEEEWTQEINSSFPDSKKAPLATVVLNTKKKNHEAFKENVKRFWELAFGMERFNCKNVSAVKSENDRYKEVIKQLEEKLQRLTTQDAAPYKVGLLLVAITPI